MDSQKGTGYLGAILHFREELLFTFLFTSLRRGSLVVVRVPFFSLLPKSDPCFLNI